MLRFESRCPEDITPLGNLPGWLSSILRSRGVDTPEKAELFLNPSLDDLHDPFLMQDMDKAVSMIRDALAAHSLIAVYGDYDVDGICAVSIMVSMLHELGAAVIYHIPDRHEDGYGLHEEAVRRIAASASLLITVDCGITNHTEVELAHSLGLKVIVTDHHQPAELPSPADAVLNPLLGHYPFRRLCGAGVALKLCQALGGMRAILPRLELAALATVADIVPLVDENRVIVREGMSMMEHSSLPGLRALIEVSGISFPITAGKIGFQLAPRLNAGGRLENASQGVELLLCGNTDTAHELAEHLNTVNTERRQMEQDMLSEAMSMMNRMVNFRTDRVLILAGKDWNNGVIGLVAGKLCEKYHFPTIVLSIHGDEAVGSCRSIPGVNIHAMLSTCKDLFTRFGGHEQAAGLTIPAHLIPELRQRLNLAIGERCDPLCFVPVQEYDLPLAISETDMDMVSVLNRLQPFGYGNPSPLFMAQNCEIQSASRVGTDRSHLKMELLQDNRTRNCIGFSMGENADRGWSAVDIVYSPEINEFRNNVSLQLSLKAIRPSAGSGLLPSPGILFGAFLQELNDLVTNEQAGKETLPVLSRSEVLESLRHVRGTLVLTHSGELAQALAAESGAELCFRTCDDPRGFSCILCCPDLSGIGDLWETVILAEHDLLPGESGWIRKQCPNAALFGMQPGTDMISMMTDINMTDDDLRKLYLVLRSRRVSYTDACAASGFSIPQIMTALTAFRDTGLVEWDTDPALYTPVIAPARCRMDDSPLIRWLRGSVKKSIATERRTSG